MNLLTGVLKKVSDPVVSSSYLMDSLNLSEFWGPFQKLLLVPILKYKPTHADPYLTC